MRPDGVLLFKIYDSDQRFHSGAPHLGFDHRLAYPNALPRESVEAQFFVDFA